jgi:hypothetical protein
VGPGALLVGSGGPGAAQEVSLSHQLKELVHTMHGVLRETWRLNLLLRVLKTLDYVPVIQQIEELSAVYFKTAHKHQETAILGALQVVKYVAGGQNIQSSVRFDCRRSCGIGAHHCEGFPASRLAICKARSLAEIKENRY